MKKLGDRLILGGSRFPLRLVLFGMAGLAAFAYGFLMHSAAEAGRLLQRFGYPVMLGTVLWWAWALFRLVRSRGWGGGVRFASRIRVHGRAFVLIGALTLVAVLTLPFSYKVLFDELVLQSTAWNLHFFREFGTLIRGYEIEGVFQSLTVFVDKRPFFFPFIVSLVHDLTGFRIVNGYLTNTALMPVALACLYFVLRTMGSARAALAGLACFGASALLSQNANGSGMELLNLVMLILTLGLAIHYLAQPEETRLSALVLSCVLLAQTRYESALYVAPVALVILEGWRRANRIILPPAALVAPLLLIPSALHNTYLSGTPVLWELRDDVSARFELRFVGGNLRHAMAYFFGLSARFLNSWWLSVAGFLALGIAIPLLLRRLRSWKDASPAAFASVLFGLAVVANLGLLMFYFWGQLDDPLVSRLVLPFHVVLALAITWGVAQLSSRWQAPLSRVLIVGALVTYVGFGPPAAAYNEKLNQQAWEMMWEEEWVDARTPAARLMITNKSALSWLIREIPAIDIGRARTKAAQIKYHMDAGTFQEVLVSQYYRPQTPEGNFQLDPREALPAFYSLEPLVERQFGGRLLRISRIVDIDVPEPIAEEITAAITPQ